METIIKQSSTRIKSLIGVIALVSALLISIFLLLGLPFVQLENSIIDFAQHHYFLMGFISLATVVLMTRLYLTVNKAFKRATINKPAVNDNKNRFERFKDKLNSRINGHEVKRVDKSQLNTLQFPNEDVLLSKQEAIERELDLQRAMKLGNAVKHKVRIFFKANNSINYVETTVWAANPYHINLKGGIVLPVKSVYKIEI